MIDINTALQNILKAIYGKQVRESIHDAIYQINQNANEAVDLAQIKFGVDIIEPTSPVEGFREGSIYFNVATGIIWKLSGGSWEQQGTMKAIDKIERTSTSGLVDTYTITFNDESTQNYTVTNGEKGVSVADITKVSTDGNVDHYEVNLSDGTKTPNGFDVANGISISDISLASQVGNVKNYDVNLTNGQKTPTGFSVADGISSYVYIRYSANFDGSGMVTVPSDQTVYIGICVTTQSTAPMDPAVYSWVRFIGKSGTGSGDMLSSDYATLYAKTVDRAAALYDGENEYDTPQILSKIRGAKSNIGVCTTEATKSEKIVTIGNQDGFELEVGSRVAVLFTATNTAQNPTLNVNGTGAKPIFYNTAVLTTSNLNKAGTASIYLEYIYDGTNWVWISQGKDDNTTYSPAGLGFGYGTCTTAEATKAKVVTLSSYALTTGGIVAVKFTNAVPATSTMNINSKGAKNIYYKGKAITDGIIKAGDTAIFVYSSQYHLLSIDNTEEVTTKLQTIGSIVGGDEWTAKSYTKGEIVIYNNKIYYCKANCGASNLPTDSNYWEETSLGKLTGNLTHKKYDFGDFQNIVGYTQGNSFVAPQDGYILVQCWSTGSIDIWINNSALKIPLSSSMPAYCLFVKAGFKVGFDRKNSTYNSANFYSLA